MLDALAAGSIFPLLLDHPVIAAKGLVEFCSSGLSGSRAKPVRIAGGGCAEVEVALVGIFLAAGVKPGVQVRIRDGLKLLVREHVDQAVCAAHAGCRAVGAGRLNFATAGAAIRIADKGVFDIDAAECGMGMETAVLGAEAGSFIDVGGSQHHIYAVGICRQGAAVEGVADRGLQAAVIRLVELFTMATPPRD